MKTMTTLIIAAALALALGAPASARPLDRGTFDFPYNDVGENFCGVEGLSITDAGAVSGRFGIRSEGKSRFPHFYLLETGQGTITAIGSGAFITYRFFTNTNDAQIKDNGDGTMTITTLQTGSFAAYDSNGKAISRNPGQHRERVVVDYNGTPANPDDDELVSVEILKQSTGRSDDFCAPALRALGVN